MKNKNRKMIIDPSTTFEPLAAVKRAWLSTRKRPITLGNREQSTTHAGFFDTDDFASDTLWFLFALVLELFSLAQLRAVGAFESLIVLAAFMLVDLLCAAFAHAGTTDWKIYRAHFQLARDQDERNWASAYKPASWRRWLKWLGVIGLIGSAIVKSGFFIENAEPSIAIVAVPLCYLVIAYAHFAKTGYFAAEIWFRFRLWLNWRRYCRNDTALCFTHPNKLNFTPKYALREVKVNRQLLAPNGNGDWALTIHGLLQDDEAADLAMQQETPEAKAEVLRVCLEFQVMQLALNPNQAIVAMPHTPPAITSVTVPVLLVILSLALPGCAKPKAKAVKMETVEVVVLAPEPKGNKLPLELIELLPPFTTPEGSAMIPNLKLRFRRAADQAICEAPVHLDQRELKPSFLSGLFGTTGLPLDQICKSWVQRAKKPLKIDTLAATEINMASGNSDLEFVQQVIQQFGSPNVFSHRCGDLSAIDPKAQVLKDHKEYQQAAIRCAMADGQASRGMLIVHGFDLPDVVAGPAEDESPQALDRPLPRKTNAISSQVRAKLPEPMRVILDRGTARVTTIHFPDNSAESPVTALAEFDRVAAEMAGMRAPTLFIVGYADRRGSVEDKMRLSRDRALAVAREMQRRQVAVSAAIGLGDALEVDLTATPEGNALNRRVDLILVEPNEG